MKIKFNRPKGYRTYKGTVKVPHKENRIPMFMGLENMDDHYLMWCDELDRWVGRYDTIEGCCSLCTISKPIRSVKAAIRHIKNHDEIPVGTRMILASSFVGYDVEIVK